MNKQIADKWVEALRSGKFKQGEQWLYHEPDDSYCCLGVLQKITGCEKSTTDLEYLADNDVLRTGRGYIPSLEIALDTLNDYGACGIEKLTFDEIADIIQICWREL